MYKKLGFSYVRSFTKDITRFISLSILYIGFRYEVSSFQFVFTLTLPNLTDAEILRKKLWKIPFLRTSVPVPWYKKIISLFLSNMFLSYKNITV